MKKRFFLPVALVAAALFSSCEELFPSREPGTLSIHFSNRALTKGADLPDSSQFILQVTGSDGVSVYDGLFGECPDPLPVDPDTYHVSVRSCDFKAPAFGQPLYGDSQEAVVSSGATVDVALLCHQLNAGIRLKIASDFLVNYPKGLFFVQSADGRLPYAYREQRIAYFHPGDVSVVLDDDGSQSILYTKDLAEREILTVAVSAPGPASSSSGKITVAIDTSRTWTDDRYIIGTGPVTAMDGRDKEHAMDVMTARGKTGATGVWVYGYIIGNASPFLGTTSDTNLAIAGKTSATSKAVCLSVELKKGAIRDALNLVSHPSNLGRKIFVKGDIITYYGIPGVKNISECVMDQ